LLNHLALRLGVLRPVAEGVVVVIGWVMGLLLILSPLLLLLQLRLLLCLLLRKGVHLGVKLLVEAAEPATL
jgi:hypothetical protein